MDGTDDRPSAAAAAEFLSLFVIDAAMRDESACSYLAAEKRNRDFKGGSLIITDICT